MHASSLLRARSLMPQPSPRSYDPHPCFTCDRHTFPLYNPHPFAHSDSSRPPAPFPSTVSCAPPPPPSTQCPHALLPHPRITTALWLTCSSPPLIKPPLIAPWTCSSRIAPWLTCNSPLACSTRGSGSRRMRVPAQRWGGGRGCGAGKGCGHQSR